MKDKTYVYLVWYDNGEPYPEDYSKDVEAVFSSYDDAVKYIEDNDFVEYKKIANRIYWKEDVADGSYGYPHNMWIVKRELLIQ